MALNEYICTQNDISFYGSDGYGPLSFQSSRMLKKNIACAEPSSKLPAPLDWTSEYTFSFETGAQVPSIVYLNPDVGFGYVLVSERMLDSGIFDVEWLTRLSLVSLKTVGDDTQLYAVCKVSNEIGVGDFSVEEAEIVYRLYDRMSIRSPHGPMELSDEMKFASKQEYDSFIAGKSSLDKLLPCLFRKPGGKPPGILLCDELVFFRRDAWERFEEEKWLGLRDAAKSFQFEY